jgi:hypothetical protein
MITEPTIKDLLSNVYYGTIRQITEDLVKQVEDNESFYSNKKEKQDHSDIKRINKLLELTKQTIQVYCGEGGIPLDQSKFELFTIKHFPEIVDSLRKNY